jgi:hypothetical protein
MEIIEFIRIHMAEFGAIGAALMVVGGLVVKITPTKTDDVWFQKITGWVGALTPKKK